jgi:hypothetical protein
MRQFSPKYRVLAVCITAYSLKFMHKGRMSILSIAAYTGSGWFSCICVRVFCCGINEQLAVGSIVQDVPWSPLYYNIGLTTMDIVDIIVEVEV